MGTPSIVDQPAGARVVIGMATRRTYHEYCAVASALDVIGDRWTLLIIRELLAGPRRYGELLADLPGLGTNLLAERLRYLLDQGVVARTTLRTRDDAQHSGRAAYRLTPTGAQLRPVVVGLARWGLGYTGESVGSNAVRPLWGFTAVEAMMDPDAVPDIDERYEFRLDGEPFHIDVHGGRATAERGAAKDPVAILHADAAAFVQIGAGWLTLVTALLTGRVTVSGDRAALLRCCALLGFEDGVLRTVPAVTRPRRHG